MAALVWGLEWRIALSRKRDLALRMVAPLSVVLVIATGAVPAAVGAASYVALFVGYAVVLTALAVRRDCESGIASRVVRAGMSPASYLMQRAAGAAGLAVVQLLPAVLAGALFLNASATEIAVALGALVVSLWIASLLGVVVAAAGRSTSEVIVLGGVSLVLLLHMSGVFRKPTAGGIGASFESAAPFTVLHEAFVTMVAGGDVRGGVTALGWAVALSAAVCFAAPRVTASLERSA